MIRRLGRFQEANTQYEKPLYVIYASFAIFA